jgi:hypothetical protein
VSEAAAALSEARAPASAARCPKPSPLVLALRPALSEAAPSVQSTAPPPRPVVDAVLLPPAPHRRARAVLAFPFARPTTPPVAAAVLLPPALTGESPSANRATTVGVTPVSYSLRCPKNGFLTS